MPGESTNPASDIHLYISIVRHWKWIIIASVGLVLAATVAATSRMTPIYTSTTRVSVKYVGAQATYIPLGTVDMNTERGIADSTATAQTVQNALRLLGSPDSYLGHLRVTIETSANILDFSYSDPVPATAKRMSQAFADAYLTNRVQQAIELIKQEILPLTQQMETLTRQIAGLNAKLSQTPNTQSGAIAYLQQQLSYDNGRWGYDQQQLVPYQAASSILCGTPDPTKGCKPNRFGGGVIQQPAPLPTAPSSPRWPVNIALELIAGLGIGLGIAFVRERLDERLRGLRDLEETMGAAVLAAVPKVAGWRRREVARLISVEDPKSAEAEAYKTLRTNLEYAGRDGGLRLIVITSPLMGEGKTATTANLAATLTQTGKRVIAVSCDLRKPRLHRFFNVDNAVGVTSVLAGKVSIVQALQRPSIENLRVLASGPVPPNPAELLGSESMVGVLAELRGMADYVILDTPPVLAVADALVLAPKSDGVLFVADSGSTNRGAAEHAREQLEQVGARIIGCILNNVDPKRAKYYPHSYRYYGSS